MKKLVAFILGVLLIIGMSAPTYAAADGQPNGSATISTKMVGVEQLDVVGSNDTFFLDGNDLFVIETVPVEETIHHVSPFSLESTKEVTADIKVYKTTLTDEEAGALNDFNVITPMSGPLTNTKQEQNAMGNIRATLSVSFDRPIYNGRQTLHLCKASGSFVNLMPPPNEGVKAETSQLYYFSQGKRYLNGVEDINTTLGFTNNYTTPTFTNIQLMPENTSMVTFFGGTGVTYTLYCTRSVTIVVGMEFS